VAAALLVREGHSVIGLTLRLWSEDHGPEATRENRCCSLESIQDARRVCDSLDAPHYVLNVESRFKEQIVDSFVQAYVAGNTPNPCVRCNQYIKFDALLSRALALGVDFLATGHYARIMRQPNEPLQLLRAVDRNKDQSYALCRLNQTQLAHSLFPLGGYSKKQVRDMARDFGIEIAAKPESQELCFVTSGTYRDFLRRQMPQQLTAGAIRHVDGRLLGQHSGLIDYTVGQRKGLGIAGPRPLFVTAIDVDANTIIVGEAEYLERQELRAGNMHYTAGAAPTRPLDVTVQVRAHALEQAGELHAQPDGSARIRLERPLRGVAPGQAVVLYQGEAVVGAGDLAA
jgi:tRNA-specific 2-thiouridylase